MTRFITSIAFFAVAIFAQQSTQAAAVAIDIDKPNAPIVNPLSIENPLSFEKPLCIDLSLDKQIDLLNRQGIASVDLNRAFDQVKPSLNNDMFRDIRPNRFSSSDIS